ncbi:hypothetical protein [Enterovibrio nigricans]|uniref:Uncharacterized protein n=1 Tax=Enterovibrio nigricans DSM 22720 TaxID=1121868 RepID=A0A1T4UVB7_9GAMM|nr:hypothetical protein [Enterovibrio nigricans]PKF50916.1 hypothetical protein AT251_07815 [Enterovibrio nigricans]SKA56614.1 hypothetical protein SAMN02745132_02600 [Enterovibrio nigricans DSM 22720]
MNELTIAPIKAIDALKHCIEKRLGLEAVVEPSNAVSRAEVRVMLTGTQKLTRLDATHQATFVPYEALVDVTISLRVSGGNTQHSISSQALAYNLELSEYLEHDLIVLEGIGQTLQNPRAVSERSIDDSLVIVGDGELTQVKFMNAGFSSTKSDDDYESRDELFVYRIDYTAKLMLTLHRRFYNPPMQQVTALNETYNEEMVITDEE